MSSLHFSPGLFVEHADEDVFVLVDRLHDVGVALTEADEEGLEKVGVVEDLVAQELELLYITEEGQRVGDTGWFAGGGAGSGRPTPGTARTRTWTRTWSRRGSGCSAARTRMSCKSRIYLKGKFSLMPKKGHIF